MANNNSIAELYGDSFSNFRIGVVRATSLNTAGNAVVTIPILSGGLTNSGAANSSGGIIVRRITIQNPSGSVASANVSIGFSTGGANLVTANTVLSSVSGVGRFQDIAVSATYQTTAITGNQSQCLFVNINTASGNANTVDIVVWGDIMRGKLLVLEEMENGCIVPLSHKLNHDGYFRYRHPDYKGKGRAPLIMYHLS